MKNITLLIFCLIAFIACQEKKTALTPSTNRDLEKGETLIFKDNDSAFYYFSKVPTLASDSLDIATSLHYMAVIQCDAGDYFGSQESLTKSLQYLNLRNAKHFSCIASNYSELGITSFNLKQYDLALSQYNLALKFNKYDDLRPIVLNNKALVYQTTGDYKKAIQIYEEIIPGLDKYPKEHSRVLSNMTRARWLQNPGYPAGQEFLKALSIRIKENDDWGKNASYMHLSDYYALFRPDSALWYAEKMFAIASKLRSPDDKLDALERLVKLSPPATTKSYLKVYLQLADSIQTARNAAKDQFAVIRYEREKSQADNLLLQQENTKKKYQLLIREIVLAALALVFTASVIIAVIRYKKRRIKLELAAHHALLENQLKTSKRVHDVVANGIYRVMTEIENQRVLDKESVLDSIENLYEESRAISYEASSKSL